MPFQKVKHKENLNLCCLSGSGLLKEKKEKTIMKTYKVFAINPGSTSTKIAMFENDKAVFSKNVSHDANKLKEFKEIRDQFDYRKETILEEQIGRAHV